MLAFDEVEAGLQSWMSASIVPPALSDALLQYPLTLS
jgi:hypothetical protein